MKNHIIIFTIKLAKQGSRHVSNLLIIGCFILLQTLSNSLHLYLIALSVLTIHVTIRKVQILLPLPTITNKSDASNIPNQPMTCILRQINQIETSLSSYILNNCQLPITIVLGIAQKPKEKNITAILQTSILCE